ncbi:hypothetical protein CDL15_Pgr010998 [Punica granatum]|uniref:Uncharacterized protein n=1 Tax=Punica granatum TaxID=22663 RepID=A0A218XMN5_PUNGR|nr:hypothetical protein CDL15_Pgr010998 [Punica granatum]
MESDQDESEDSCGRGNGDGDSWKKGRLSILLFAESKWEKKKPRISTRSEEMVVKGKIAAKGYMREKKL